MEAQRPGPHPRRRASRDASVSPPSPPELDAQELWLTDTGCDQRQSGLLLGNHSTNNTLGECATGTTSGPTPGAPDLLATEAPPLDPDFPADQQPIFDLATDLEPVEHGDADRGLQLNAQARAGCTFSPDELAGTVRPHQQTHRWLTAPMPDGFTFVAEDTGTLELWTQTLNGAIHPGRVCVHLFSRETNQVGDSVDAAIANARTGEPHFTHSYSPWPAGDWARVTIPLEFPLTASTRASAWAWRSLSSAPAPATIGGLDDPRRPEGSSSARASGTRC